MPWQHCTHVEISDDRTCPTCGLSKQEWTLKVEVTRVFRVGAAPAVKIELKDEAGAYKAGERYRIDLPDGMIALGELNPAGYAKATSKIKGDARVSFPDLGEGVAAVTPTARPSDVPGQFLCAAGAKEKFEFKVALSWPGDAAAQADTLRRAARSGTPFCEECERAKQVA